MVFAIYALLILLASTLGAADYDGEGNREAGPYEPEITRGEWIDSERDGREVPWKLFYPGGLAGPVPVVIWSHGSGGSREGADYLGNHLASHGYAAFHIQHHGSDIDQARAIRAAGSNAGSMSIRGPGATIARFQDVGFAVKQIEAMNGDNRFDVAAMGMSGHSFGGSTTLTAAGMRYGPDGRRFAVGQLKGAFVMSPSPPRGANEDPDVVFAEMVMPIFHLTGTNDKSSVVPDAASRRIPFESISNVDQYLVVFDGGIHGTFSGGTRNGYAGIERHHEIIKMAAIAFWDCRLQQNDSACSWIETGGFSRELAPADTFEVKPARGNQ